MVRTPILGMYAQWPWPWRYDLGSRSCHILGSWTAIFRTNIHIQQDSEELRPGYRFLVCAPCYLDLREMTLSHGHDTPLGHGHHLCEILSRSNMAVEIYGPDMDFRYVRTVTLNLEIWPWVNGIRSGHTLCSWCWAMDNICVKYYPNPTRKHGFMAWTRIFGYVYTVTLTFDLVLRSWHILELWTTSCVKYYPDPTKGSEVMTRTWCEQTDIQTNSMIPI